MSFRVWIGNKDRFTTQLKMNKCYVASIEDWGLNENSSNIVGVFTDIHTAWKNALRVEFITNIQYLNPGSWGYAGKSMTEYEERRNRYAQLYRMMMLQPEFTFTETFGMKWDQARIEFVELFRMCGYLARVNESTMNMQGEVISLLPAEEELDEEIRASAQGVQSVAENFEQMNLHPV